MPRASCPACKADVRYPADAEVGDTATCPECDEVFTPPKLVKKAKKYDPMEEEGYRVERADTADQPEMDKTRYAGAAMRGARRDEESRREMARDQRRFWFDGPEIWLLIFGVGAGVGLPFGLWLARSWDKLGDKKVFLILVVMLAVMFAAIGLGGSAWAWLRRNR